MQNGPVVDNRGRLNWPVRTALTPHDWPLLCRSHWGIDSGDHAAFWRPRCLRDA